MYKPDIDIKIAGQNLEIVHTMAGIEIRGLVTGLEVTDPDQNIDIKTDSLKLDFSN